MLLNRPILMIFACIFWGTFALIAQDTTRQQAQTIRFKNPSFEDEPTSGLPPKGWEDCGFKGESPADVQPNGGFNCTKKAFHGKTYLAMVVRDNQTWESVGQKLSSHLLAGQSYKLSFYVCRSPVYKSQSRVTSRETDYIQSTVVRIWSGKDGCDEDELLATTQDIGNLNWEKIEVLLKPSKNVSFLIFDAFYSLGTIKPYNGNVLIDNLSDIVPISN